MEKRQVNPWAWQDARGFSQAWRVDGADYRRVKAEFIADPQPASTALQVTALAAPEIMIEVEAIAVL